jgi:hypothetical protein
VLRLAGLPRNSRSSTYCTCGTNSPCPIAKAIGIYKSPLESHFRCKSHGAATFVREVLPRNLQSIANAPLTRPSATLSPRVREGRGQGEGC